MSHNERSEVGNACPNLWPAACPDSFEIVELSGREQDVAAYAAAIAVAQVEYPGHFGHHQFTAQKANMLLNLPNMTTYAVRDAAGGVLGAMSVHVAAGSARFEYLFRMKAMRDSGLGKQLLLRGLHHALRHGARRVALDVMRHNPVQELYDALGFKPYDDDFLDMDGAGSDDVISMELRGNQAICEAQARLEAIIGQQLNPDPQQQIA